MHITKQINISLSLNEVEEAIVSWLQENSGQTVPNKPYIKWTVSSTTEGAADVLGVDVSYSEKVKK